jgi:hypothetical protein
MSTGADILDQIGSEEWEMYRRCRFVRKTFQSYPCLVMIDPINKKGGTLWRPYRGEPFDPTVFRLVEGAWDHEHCNVCYAKIFDGHTYWTNDGEKHVDLCDECYPLVSARL